MAYPRLRDLREDADLTQAQIAAILHMHKTTYVRYNDDRKSKRFYRFDKPFERLPAK